MSCANLLMFKYQSNNLMFKEMKNLKQIPIIPAFLSLLLLFSCQDTQLKKDLLDYHKAEVEEASNIEVIKKWYSLLDKQDFDSWSSLFTDDSRGFMGSSKKPSSYKDAIPFIKKFYVAFPDYSHKIENIFASRNYVVAQLLCTGTHKNTFAEIPATNNKIEYKEIFIFKMKNGKIQETYGIEDNLTMMKQLGLELK